MTETVVTPPLPPDATDEGRSSPRREAVVAWSRRHPDLAGLGSLMLLVGVLVSLHVGAVKQISPLDELPHIDSMIKASRFELVRVGDPIGQQALREEACRGFARPEEPIPPCDAPVLLPEQFQDLGYNTAATKFPIYHFVTGLTARLLVAVTPIDSIVSAARLMGVLWLGGAVALSWLLLAQFGLSRPARGVVLAILATTPTVLHLSSIVNPDSLLVLTGAAIAYTVVRWEKGTLPAWIPAITTAGALIIEVTNVVIVAVAALYLIARVVTGDSQPGHGTRRRFIEAARRGKGPLSMALAMGIGALGFLVFYTEAHDALIGQSDTPNQITREESYALSYRPPEVISGDVPAERIAGEVDALITPVRRPFVPPVLSGPATTVMITFAHYLLIAGLGVVLFTTAARERIFALALAALVVMALAGPALAWDNARRDVFFAIPPRFGLPVLPVLAVTMGWAIRRRGAVVTIGALAGLSVTSVVVQLAGG